MFVVFPNTHTDTQYDYYTLLPTLHGEGNNDVIKEAKQCLTSTSHPVFAD